MVDTFLDKDCSWEVGDRASIQFFNDTWVSSSPFKFWPNLTTSASINEDPSAQEFITPAQRWDEARLISSMDEEVTRSICKIIVPQVPVAYRLCFLGNDLNKYSVSNAYRILMARTTSDDTTEW